MNESGLKIGKHRSKFEIISFQLLHTHCILIYCIYRVLTPKFSYSRGAIQGHLDQTVFDFAFALLHAICLIVAEYYALNICMPFLMIVLLICVFISCLCIIYFFEFDCFHCDFSIIIFNHASLISKLNNQHALNFLLYYILQLVKLGQLSATFSF